MQIAVIDTETTWQNTLMSIGVVVADANTYNKRTSKYYVIKPDFELGGMYEDRLFPDFLVHPIICTRDFAMNDIRNFLNEHGVNNIYAYNAKFDHGHMPELSDFSWYDIMRLAAYKQYNPNIPDWVEICSTGKMRRNYGVEPITRMLSGGDYEETHNAVLDAIDELKIMEMLGHPIEMYEIALIK